MKINELYEELLEEGLAESMSAMFSHAPWMADVIIRLPRDPAFKKLHPSTREEIERIITAIE